MDNDEDWGNDHCMEYVRNVVNDFRLATKFLKRLIKCKETLERIQHLQHIHRFLSVYLDVKTRWNSIYLMLRRMIKMPTTIDQFQVYLRSTEGKRNFRSTKAKFPLLSEEKWAIAHGLCYIFTVFEKATRALGGQKYPTFVSGFAYLRGIHNHLNNQTMFTLHGPRDKFKTSFYNRFGECPFFENVVTKLDLCRRKLLESFECRFNSLNNNIL